MANRDLGDGRLDAGLTGQLCHVALLARRGERDDHTLIPGSCGPTGPVQVCLVLGRGVSVDHQGDVIDVDPSGGDISGHENGGPALGESGEISDPNVL